MPRSKTMLAVLIAAGAIFAAQAALADTLVLNCKLHWTKAGGGARDSRRRLEINLADRSVRFYDDFGAGMKFVRQKTFVSASGDRINLDDPNGVRSYLDRRTGAYFLKNRTEEIHGTCVKAATRPRAF